MKTDFSKITKNKTPEESPGFLLWRVSTSWRRKIEEVLKPLDLTHPQFVILITTGWLTRNGEKVTQAEIGRQAGLDPNTTSQILRGLLAKKLIKYVKDSNVRSKFSTLTELGGKKLAKAFPVVEKANADFFEAVNLKKSGFLECLQNLMSQP